MRRLLARAVRRSARRPVRRSLARSRARLLSVTRATQGRRRGHPATASIDRRHTHDGGSRRCSPFGKSCRRYGVGALRGTSAWGTRTCQSPASHSWECGPASSCSPDGCALLRPSSRPLCRHRRRGARDGMQSPRKAKHQDTTPPWCKTTIGPLPRSARFSARCARVSSPVSQPGRGTARG